MARKSKKVIELLEAVSSLNAIRMQMRVMATLLKTSHKKPLLEDFQKLERAQVNVNRKVRSLANQLHVKLQN